MNIYAYGFSTDLKRTYKRITFDTLDQPAQVFFSDADAVKSTFAEAQAALSSLYTHRILFCIPGGKHGSNDP